jgi:hypothetical protein
MTKLFTRVTALLRSKKINFHWFRHALINYGRWFIHTPIWSIRNRRQKSDETIQAFSDELYTLSRQAYPNLHAHEAFIETELIEIFIDGLDQLPLV